MPHRARVTVRGRGIRHASRTSSTAPSLSGQAKRPQRLRVEVVFDPGPDLFSQGPTSQVSSALVGLTAVFGMGTGVTPPLQGPRRQLYQRSWMVGKATADGGVKQDGRRISPAAVVRTSVEEDKSCERVPSPGRRPGWVLVIGQAARPLVRISYKPYGSSTFRLSNMFSTCGLT